MMQANTHPINNFASLQHFFRKAYGCVCSSQTTTTERKSLVKKPVFSLSRQAEDLCIEHCPSNKRKSCKAVKFVPKIDNH